MQSVCSALERFVSASRELSNSWIPIQPHTATILKGKFKDGSYACSRAHLARDIRQDPGLYLYCLKELAGRMPGSDHTPLELIFHAPLEWVHEIISEAPVTERLENLENFQAARIKETMVAAVTAELLSPAVSIDPELGYTCSLIRQIGLTLAAWNYPAEYKKALSRANAEHSLDIALKEVLGFSATALGISYARDWRLCSEIQDALRINSESHSVFAQSERLVRHENPGNKLRKICDIGEKLARSLQPSIYGESTQGLELAQTELIRHLGADAIKQISQTTRRRLMHYRSYELHMPAVASTEDLKRAVAASVQSEEWKKQNPQLKKLDENHQQALGEVYKQLTPHDIARNAIRKLVQEVIQQFGFSAGYVYLYAPKQSALTASLTIGEPSKHSPQRISMKLAMDQKHLARCAYSLSSVLRANISLADNSAGTGFAARIGSTPTIGVLYLEATAESLACSEVEPIVRFQAVLNCLAAALHAQ